MTQKGGKGEFQSKAPSNQDEKLCHLKVSRRE
jgi:hypothetical protein